jgi:hypothetical protein
LSLKTIHIAFVVLCCALALFLAAYSATVLEGSARWIWAAVSLVCAAAVVAYGIRFIKKTRDLP